MKRLLTLIVAAAFALTAYPAFAAVNSTPHDFTSGGTAYGLCEVCHVPHAASSVTAKRLWRLDVTITVGANWTQSVVGDLCGTCHMSSPLISTTNTNGDSGHNVESTAYNSTAAPTSHGRTVGTLTGAIGDTPAATGSARPYMSGGTMECTSCHNPHDDTLRPFLRTTDAAQTSISLFCADCHNRYNQNVGVNNIVATAGDRSMHPVDKLYEDDTNNNSNGGVTQFHEPYSTINTAVTATAWDLSGGKFQNADNSPKTNTNPVLGNGYEIGCQTCHQIHNPAASSDNSGSLYLLAIDNEPSMTNNGAPLCQECHGGGNQRFVNNMFVGAATSTNLDDHPIDITPDGTPALYNWSLTNRWERDPGSVDYWPFPVGGSYAPGATIGTIGRIVCTSCHSAHNARTATSLNREGGGPTYTPAVNWCYSCHQESDTVPGNHHSTQDAGMSGGGNWSSSAIGCNDCHTGTGGLLNAHMGFFNLNVAGGYNDSSQLCMTCHGNSSDPVVDAVAYPSSIPNGHLSSLGTVSHYLGTFTNAANSINVKTGKWMDAVNNGRGASYSKYGSAANAGAGGHADTHNAVAPTLVAGDSTMVCESCHAVLYNAGDGSLTGGWNINLLLENYEDNTPGTTTGAVSGTSVGGPVGSGLCVACHNQNHDADGAGSSDGFVAHSIVNGSAGAAIVPANMHPMTGWDITRAIDAGRTPTTLITADNGAANPTYADASGAPNGGSYDAANTMSCDGCHRPHLALGGWSVSYAGAVRPVILEQGATGNATTAGDYGGLCQQCHNM
jgi:predicted CXXCH cytochrome family protein